METPVETEVVNLMHRKRGICQKKTKLIVSEVESSGTTRCTVFAWPMVILNQDRVMSLAPWPHLRSSCCSQAGTLSHIRNYGGQDGQKKTERIMALTHQCLGFRSRGGKTQKSFYICAQAEVSKNPKRGCTLTSTPAVPAPEARALRKQKQHEDTETYQISLNTICSNGFFKQGSKVFANTAR